MKEEIAHHGQGRVLSHKLRTTLAVFLLIGTLGESKGPETATTFRIFFATLRTTWVVPPRLSTTFERFFLGTPACRQAAENRGTEEWLCIHGSSLDTTT